MNTLQFGFYGGAVSDLQTLLDRACFHPGVMDGEFGPATEAAVLAFQRSEGLEPDGIVGPDTWDKLRAIPDPNTPPTPRVSDTADKLTPAILSRLFPYTHMDIIEGNLIGFRTAMRFRALADEEMLAMALGTIAAECGNFEPVTEGVSRFNTSPGSHPFNLYDCRKDLGNRGAPDGEMYKGRGYVQLTGFANYAQMSGKIGIDLITNPEEALDTLHSAQILAQFLKDRELQIRNALSVNMLSTARKLVNGGTHGLDAFTAAYQKARQLLS